MLFSAGSFGMGAGSRREVGIIFHEVEYVRVKIVEAWG